MFTFNATERTYFQMLEQRTPGVVYLESVTSNRCRLRVKGDAWEFAEQEGEIVLFQKYPYDDIYTQAFLKARDLISCVRNSRNSPYLVKDNIMLRKLNQREQEYLLEHERHHPGVVWPESISRNHCVLKTHGKRFVFGNREGIFMLIESNGRVQKDVYSQASLKARAFASALRRGHKEAVEWRRLESGRKIPTPDTSVQLNFDFRKNPLLP